MTHWTKADIELAFIREFHSHLDECLLTTGTQATQRMDRIRIAIHKHKRSDLPFFDSGMTYRHAFEIWCGRTFELRSKPRAVAAKESAA